MGFNLHVVLIRTPDPNIQPMKSLLHDMGVSYQQTEDTAGLKKGVPTLHIGSARYSLQGWGAVRGRKFGPARRMGGLKRPLQSAVAEQHQHLGD